MTQVQRHHDWEQRYEARDVWSGNVNVHLTDWVATHRPASPGTAIDLACGEGADAIWLAEQGWRVMAVDFASVAIERASRVARDKAMDIRWMVADLTDWQAPEAVDLVSLSFFHESRSVRVGVWQRASLAVAPMGTLLVSGHAVGTEGEGGPPADTRFTADEVVDAVTAWDQRWRADVRQIRREGVGHHAGHVMTDEVIALTRVPSVNQH